LLSSPSSDGDNDDGEDEDEDEDADEKISSLYPASLAASQIFKAMSSACCHFDDGKSKLGYSKHLKEEDGVTVVEDNTPTACPNPCKQLIYRAAKRWSSTA
jgi:hypothetical protein